MSRGLAVLLAAGAGVFVGMQAPINSLAASTSSGGPSNSSSSWIVRIWRVARPDSASAAWQRTIASLMMSAAVPWIGVLTARRSPCVRTW